MYTFKDVYEKAKISTDPTYDELKDARNQFRMFLEEIRISEDCFKDESGMFKFNDDGMAFAVDLLTHRSEEPYKSIRRGRFTPEHKDYYRLMLDQICSNYRSVLEEMTPTEEDDFDEEDFDIESKIKTVCREYWMGKIQENNLMDILPSVSWIEGLPNLEKNDATLIAKDMTIIEEYIHNDILCVQQKWRSIIEGVIDYRKQERARIYAQVDNDPVLQSILEDAIVFFFDDFFEDEHSLSKEREWFRENNRKKEQLLYYFFKCFYGIKQLIAPFKTVDLRDSEEVIEEIMKERGY